MTVSLSRDQRPAQSVNHRSHFSSPSLFNHYGACSALIGSQVTPLHYLVSSPFLSRSCLSLIALVPALQLYLSRSLSLALSRPLSLSRPASRLLALSLPPNMMSHQCLCIYLPDIALVCFSVNRNFQFTVTVTHQRF